MPASDLLLWDEPIFVPEDESEWATKLKADLVTIFDLLPRFNVRDSGALSAEEPGYSEAANKAAFEATRLLLVDSLFGGTFEVPEGFYGVSDWSLVLPASAGKSYAFDGVNRYASFVFRSVDGDLGDKFIEAQGVDVGPVFSVVRNVSIVGPGTGLVFGTSPADMDGLATTGGMIVYNIMVSGFRHGIVDRSNHVSYHQVLAHNNYHGVYVSEGDTTRSDILFDNCDLTSNAYASVAIAAGAENFLGGTTFLRGHLGYGPYGIWMESEGTYGVDYVQKLFNVQFLGTSWEALGNAAIYSENKTAACSFVMFEGCHPFSLSNALYGLPSSASNYMFRVGRASGWQFSHCGLTGFGYAPTVAYIDCDFMDAPMTWDYSWLAPFAVSMATVGLSFIRCAVPVAGVHLGPAGGGLGYPYVGIEAARAYTFTGTVAQGDLMQMDGGFAGSWAVVQRNTGTKTPVGVAMNAPETATELVVTIRTADAALLNTTIVTPDITKALVPDGATPHKVTQVAVSAMTAAQAACVVGGVNLGALTGGQVAGSISL